MNGILQGTTPDFTVYVKPEDFAVSDVTKLEIVIWSSNNRTTYGFDDVTVDTENNAFSIHFTEAFTLSLGVANSFRWQMRCMFADGNIVGTQQSAPIPVSPLKSKEVMT